MPEVPKQWLEKIIEREESAIIVIDRERVIRYANTHAVHFAHRTSLEEIIGMRYDAILAERTILDYTGSPATPEQFPSVRVFKEGKAVEDVRFEQIYEGEHIWMNVSAVPLPDPDGAVTHALVSFLDISLKKRHEDQLRFLIESNRILSLTTDFKTRLTQKARLTVPTLADWCTVNTVNEDGSLTRIAIVHRDPSKVPLVAKLAELSMEASSDARNVKAVLDTTTPRLYEYVRADAYANPAMRELVAELQVSSTMIIPIISHGAVLGILSLAYAESGRHYTEEDLDFMTEFCSHLGVLVDNARLYEEIQRRDAAKDAFLAALSHELRNPLAPIKSSLELLKVQGLSEISTQTLSIVEHQFDHLTKLLNDLLDVTRYSRGMVHIEKVPVDLCALARTSADIVRPFFERKHVEFVARFPHHAVMVEADPTRLEQSILNLLHNAAKFTPEGGRVALTLDDNAQEARIRIADTGVGMTKQEVAQLFELGSAGKYKGEGLGLGLILVREILRLHGGTVEARSGGLEHGSEFILTFPLPADHQLEA